MAVRYTNPNAKVTSGVIVSGKEADKVFSIFDEKNRTKEYVEEKLDNMRDMFSKPIQKAS